MQSIFKALAAIIAVGLSGVASASTLDYQAHLTGGAESPSPGIGFVDVLIDDVANTMQLTVSFSGLLSTTTASHIHCCTASAGTGTAGVATMTPSFTGFPLGVTSGTYMHTFDLTQTSTFNSSFVSANGGTASGATAALLGGMAAGKAYYNIHTNSFPGGEIIGYLAPVPVPSAIWLLGSALGGLGVIRRRCV